MNYLNIKKGDEKQVNNMFLSHLLQINCQVNREFLEIINKRHLKYQVESDPLEESEVNSEVKYETSGETSEKVVKRLNGKNYLFVPKILTEQHEEASGSGITESGLDSNEEFESDFQTNRKAEFQPNPDSSPVTIITDTTDPKTSSGTTEKMTEPLKPFVVVTTPILAPNNGNLGINIGEQMFIESEQTTMTDDDSNSSIMMTQEEENETNENEAETTTETSMEVTETAHEENTTEAEKAEKEDIKESEEDKRVPKQLNDGEQERKDFENEFTTEAQTDYQLSTHQVDNFEEAENTKRTHVVKSTRRKQKTVVKTSQFETKQNSINEDEEFKLLGVSEEEGETRAVPTEDESEITTIAKIEDDSNEKKLETTEDFLDDDSNENKIETTEDLDDDSNENKDEKWSELKSEDFKDEEIDGTKDENDSVYFSEEYRDIGDGSDYNEGKKNLQNNFQIK